MGNPYGASARVYWRKAWFPFPVKGKHEAIPKGITNKDGKDPRWRESCVCYSLDMTHEDLIKKHRLSPAMVEVLTYHAMDDMLPAGPTRAALMRRGLVIKRGRPFGRFGYLTEDGREVVLALQDNR